MNAANAEESASASEEMNAQAEQMKSMVAGLVTLVGEGDRATYSPENLDHNRLRKPVNEKHPALFAQPSITQMAMDEEQNYFPALQRKGTHVPSIHE